MILIDTSVWIAHFREEKPRLAALLGDGEVLTHPFVVGELACGTLRGRQQVLSYLDRLDSAPVATSQEARRLIETRKLMGQGLGWTDVHLLASCLLAGAELWSLDHRLALVAERLGVTAAG